MKNGVDDLRHKAPIRYDWISAPGTERGVESPRNTFDFDSALVRRFRIWRLLGSRDTRFCVVSAAAAGLAGAAAAAAATTSASTASQTD